MARRVQTPVENPDLCPLCERPNYYPSNHHMVPKSRGGRYTRTICCDCHKAIHAHFSNKELERKYFTAEALLSDLEFLKTVEFLRKQDPRRRMRTVPSKGRGRRKVS